MPKKKKLWTKEEERIHFDRLGEIGCIICLTEEGERTKAEIHHLRKGVGMAQKSPPWRAIPLCPEHHRTGNRGVAFHAGQESQESKYQSEEFYLEVIESYLRRHDLWVWGEKGGPLTITRVKRWDA